MKHFFNRLRKHELFWWVLALAGLALFFYPLTLLEGTVVENRLCKSCHEMSPAWTSWSRSDHPRTSCRQCHQGVSLTGFYLRHLTRTTKLTAGENGLNIPGENCLNCHRNLDQKKGKEVSFSHDRHRRRNISCQRCHRRAGHWPESLKKVPMAQCLTCHDGVKAHKDCSTCHTDRQLPEEHKARDWFNRHGQAGKGRSRYCGRCHRNLTIPDRQGISYGYNQYRGLSPRLDCGRCHGPKHPPGWLDTHRKEVSGKGAGKCMACHNPVQCSGCHQRQKK